MTKYRSRSMVEATQWVPGKKVGGVYELEGGVAVVDMFRNQEAMISTDVLMNLSRLAEIRPGYYVIEMGNSRRLMKPEEFEAQYENVGG